MPIDHRWHRLTRSLVDRAGRAGRQLDRPGVERIIDDVAEEHGQPVIKWIEYQERAFQQPEPEFRERLVRMTLAQILDAVNRTRPRTTAPAPPHGV